MSPPVRLGAIIFGVALLLLAAFLRIKGAPIGSVAGLILLGLALSAGTIFESRYKAPQQGTPGAGWVDSGERFIDPETGKLVSVFTRPETGEREYRSP